MYRAKHTTEENFWNHVEKTDSCWLWTTLKKARYGSLSVNGKTMGAHCYSYQLHHGAIPEGMHVRHSCDNPACVNPAHLSIGTAKENMADRAERNRQFNQQKTHCPRGHEFTEENTYYNLPPRRPGRACKQCHLAACKRSRLKRKLQSCESSSS